MNSYVAARQHEGAANGTINREPAALKRAYALGLQGGKIVQKPHIAMLAENNVRQGFFERDQFDAVLKRLAADLQPVATFGYITGWRLREVLRLTWGSIDFKAGTVRLEPGTTKNRDGRTFPFTPDLRSLLEAQRALTDRVQVQIGRIIPNVFHRHGKPIKSFRKAWDTSCTKAGLPGKLFHDFRRTAVRNLERAGVPRSVAMQMVGHKTESMYRRYAIVSDADLRAAAEKLAALGPSLGTSLGTTAIRRKR